MCSKLASPSPEQHCIEMHHAGYLEYRNTHRARRVYSSSATNFSSTCKIKSPDRTRTLPPDMVSLGQHHDAMNFLSVKV
jgi:hypothetical protein